MNFTQANGFVLHTETGYRMAQDTGVVPTEIAAADANMVVWSMMQVVLKAGRTPITFNPDLPESYSVFLKSILDLCYPLKREVVMHCPAAEWNPNLLFPWMTWVQAPARTVAGQLDGADTAPGGWGGLGNVVGALTATLDVPNLPPHSHDLPPVYDPDEAEHVAFGGARAEGDSTVLTTAQTGEGEAFGIVQPTQIVVRWIRTA